MRAGASGCERVRGGGTQGGRRASEEPQGGMEGRMGHMKYDGEIIFIDLHKPSCIAIPTLVPWTRPRV